VRLARASQRGRTALS